ncbi:hypothetical protein GYA19_00310 [Candidatus Beckwithbacteria bacterium]|nr:hypothetical protein [Candidatus Beckwithbacteria bacterium]
MATTKIDNSWFLLKTRDPVPWMRIDDEIKLFDSDIDKAKKLIIQNPDPKQDGYYGGINEYGVAFVATFLPVAENQISYIRRPYVRLILDAQNARQALKLIKSFNPKIGGNFFIADKNDCFEIEGAPSEYFVKKINKPLAKTNHFLHLPYQNLQINIDGYRNWTETRLKTAQALIDKAKNIYDLENILKDRTNAKDKAAICMLKGDWDYNPPTASAFIFDTKNTLVYYCQGNPLEKKFKKYSFS